MANQYVTWQGRRYSPQMRDAVQEWQRLAKAAGVPFTVTQGGFNRGGVTASAGTHDGDAVDLSVRGLSQGQVATLIELGRRIGLAAWFRTTSAGKWGTRAQGFGSYHIHAVPNGWGVPSSGARSQAVAYRAGRDGLARNLADLGPGHTGAYRTRTWPDYLASRSPGLPSSGVNNVTKPTTTAPSPEEDDMTPEQDKLLRDIAVKVLGREGREDVGAIAARHVWAGTTVQRGTGPVAAIQELANANTGIVAVQGQLAGLTAALQSLAAGQGVDLDAVQAAARKGVEQGLAGATVTVELGG